MKRKVSKSHAGDEESRLSQLLFSKSKDLVDKLNTPQHDEPDIDQKAVWKDEDDEEYRANIIPNVKSTASYTEKLKQKYEVLIGTPSWAKINKRIKTEDEGDEILRTVGHLKKKNKSTNLPKGSLDIKRLPKINATTGNEGPIISCVEFHPKMSVALVAGQAGKVSLFSIGGNVNQNLHSFNLRGWKITSAHFTPDGSEAFIASQLNNTYCVYDLIQAQRKLEVLPQVVTTPKIFQMSSDGKYIATSPGFDIVYLISVVSRELLRVLKHNNTVTTVAFSPNCEKMYSFCEQGDVVIWDLSIFRVVGKFYDNGCVTASNITMSNCGKLLATGSGEGIVNVYETANLTTSQPLPIKTISNLTTKITGIKFNATSEILGVTSGLYPNAVKLVHIPSYHVFSNFPLRESNLYQVDGVSFSPNSGYMALGNNKGCAHLYRLKYYKNY